MTEQKEKNEYKLSTEVVAHIAQLLQLAILTGTEIVENFSLIRLEESDLNPEELVLGERYKEQADKNINDLVQAAEMLSEAEMSGQLPENDFEILDFEKLRLKS